MTEKVIRSIDLVDAGADGLREFIASVMDNEAKAQPYVPMETDDMVIIDKVELVFDGEGYNLRFSGL